MCITLNSTIMAELEQLQPKVRSAMAETGVQRVDRCGPVRKVEAASFLYKLSFIQIILDHELSQIAHNLTARCHLQVQAGADDHTST